MDSQRGDDKNDCSREEREERAYGRGLVRYGSSRTGFFDVRGQSPYDRRDR